MNRSLRDQFVCGIRDPTTRKKLLSEDRTFQQALQVAIADEVAAKETMQVQQQQQLSQPVNSVTKHPLTLSSSSREIHVYGLLRDKFFAKLRLQPNRQLLTRVSPVGILII